MEILINKQPLDFALEEEKNLRGVVAGIESWLGSAHLILTSIKHKNRELLNEEHWEEIPITEIGQLEMTARHIEELRITNMLTIQEFLKLLAEALDQKKRGILTDLLNGFQYLLESFQKQFRQVENREEQSQTEVAEQGFHNAFEQDLKLLRLLFRDSDTDAVLSWPEQKRNESIDLIGRVEAQVALRLREITDPREALRLLLQDLNRSIEEIGEVAVLLQTGKDRQAMETIIRFSELSQCLVRIFSSLKLTAKNHSRIGGKSFDTFFTELNLMLEELLEAFNHQDSVLIGDLLEYEIAPRLEELKDFTEGSI